MRLLRFEDAVAIKHMVNFYITKGCELKMKGLGRFGFGVALMYGDLPLKGNLTMDELIND